MTPKRPLSERIHPGIEAAPWVCEEVVRLEQQVVASEKLKTAMTAWAKWYSARLDRINKAKTPIEDYSGYEQDLFEALGCSTEPFEP